MGKVSTRSFNLFKYCSNSSSDALISCYIYLFTNSLIVYWPPLRIRTWVVGFKIISGDHYTITAHIYGSGGQAASAQIFFAGVLGSGSFTWGSFGEVGVRWESDGEVGGQTPGSLSNSGIDLQKHCQRQYLDLSAHLIRSHHNFFQAFSLAIGSILALTKVVLIIWLYHLLTLLFIDLYYISVIVRCKPPAVLSQQ